MVVLTYKAMGFLVNEIFEYRTFFSANFTLLEFPTKYIKYKLVHRVVHVCI